MEQGPRAPLVGVGTGDPLSLWFKLKMRTAATSNPTPCRHAPGGGALRVTGTHATVPTAAPNGKQPGRPSAGECQTRDRHTAMTVNDVQLNATHWVSFTNKKQNTKVSTQGDFVLRWRRTWAWPAQSGKRPRRGPGLSASPRPASCSPGIYERGSQGQEHTFHMHGSVPLPSSGQTDSPTPTSHHPATFEPRSHTHTEGCGPDTCT